MNLKQSKVQAVYTATSEASQAAAYDQWAGDYDRDLWCNGYSIPAQIAALFARFVDPQNGPFLDAGCGTGMQLSALAAAGYYGFTGVDLSASMIEIARAKGIYDQLVQASLGATLPFDDNKFHATLTCGTITQGHAPPDSFAELIRVTRPGGYIVFTLRNDPGIDPAYNDILNAYAEQGLWRLVFAGPTTLTMPYGEPEVTHRGWVFQVCDID